MKRSTASKKRRATSPKRVHPTLLQTASQHKWLLTAFVLPLLVTLTVLWFLRNGSGQMASQDSTLIAFTQQEQRSDGFFVFSQGESSPPVIAESYFAAIVFRHFKEPVPHSQTLISSLEAYEQQASEQIAKGQMVLGPRDVYEALMLHYLVTGKAASGNLSPFLPLLHQEVASNPKISYASIHDWYYAVLSLSLLGSLTETEKAAIAQTARAALDPQADAEPIVIGMVVDACNSSGVVLNSNQLTLATLVLQHPSPEGAFTDHAQTAADLFTTFFIVLMADDLHQASVLQVNALRTWIMGLRSSTGFQITADQPVTPFGTTYALLTEEALTSHQSAMTPR